MTEINPNRTNDKNEHTRFSSKSNTNDKINSKSNKKSDNLKENFQNLNYTIYQNAYHELLLNGFLRSIDKDNTFTISKRRNGEWFKCNKKLLSSRNIKPFNFKKMPALKKLTDLIDQCDPELKICGGKVFITEELAFRIKDSEIITFKLTPQDTNIESINVALINHAIKHNKKITFSYIDNSSTRSTLS